MGGIETGRVSSYLTSDGRYLYILFRIERDAPELHNYPKGVMRVISLGEKSSGGS